MKKLLLGLMFAAGVWGQITTIPTSGGVDLSAATFLTLDSEANLSSEIVSKAWGAPVAFGSLPACNSAEANFLRPLISSYYDFSYCDGSSRTYYRNGLSLTPVPSTGWAYYNQETGDSVTHTNEAAYFVAVRTAVGEHTVYYRDAPTAPYTVDFFMYVDWSGENGGGSGGGRDANIGVYFSDSTEELIYFGVGAFGDSQSIQIQNWSSADGSLSSTIAGETSNGGGALTNLLSMNPIRLRIVDNNTNLQFFRFVGNQPIQFHTDISRTAHLTSGPTRIGFGGYKGDGTIRAVVYAMNVQ